MAQLHCTEHVFEHEGVRIEYRRPDRLESEDVTCGDHWESATRAACAYLKKHIELVKRKVIVEVGCGLGVLGMYCALLGAEKVILTDKDPEALKLCNENIRLNRLSCHTQILDWANKEAAIPDCDIVVGSDVIYVTAAAKHLHAKIAEMAKPKQGAYCILGHVKRFSMYMLNGVATQETEDGPLEVFREAAGSHYTIEECGEAHVVVLRQETAPVSRKRQREDVQVNPSALKRRVAINPGSDAFSDAVAVGVMRFVLNSPPPVRTSDTESDEPSSQSTPVEED